ncbi:MAG: hypothetical protein M3370_09230, partial [Actinomycetota bacterium]|nr:hypothetical protein [Actinomycetota bacterium]
RLRSLTADARAAAREVLAEGSQMSSDVRDLAGSLRTNAERLLEDVREAHASLTARLDRVAPETNRPPTDREESARQVMARRGRGTPEPPTDEFDVPEFVPRR